MMEMIIGILKESFFLLNKMSLYLLFGFLFAGVVHVFLTESVIAKHLGKNSFLSVIKAALFGIPLPICSCGVVPAAMSLKREGASKGSVLSFLIATPTSGIDSIMATYSLLGGFFAVYRVIASFVAATFAGILANLFFKGEPETTVYSDEEKSCKVCECEQGKKKKTHQHSFMQKLKGVFRYAFFNLLADIGDWLVIGILIGGAIAYFLPSEFIHTYLGSGWKAMILMLVIGIPMYVCATGSIPIAASLVLKGLSPGAAFVFLLACPATNSVSVTVIAKELGKKAAVIYLFAISFSAVVLGVLLDSVWAYLRIKPFSVIVEKHAMAGGHFFEIAGSIILLGLIGWSQVKNRQKKSHK